MVCAVRAQTKLAADDVRGSDAKRVRQTSKPITMTGERHGRRRLPSTSVTAEERAAPGRAGSRMA